MQKSNKKIAYPPLFSKGAKEKAGAEIIKMSG